MSIVKNTLTVLVSVMLLSSVNAYESKQDCEAGDAEQFTFSWPIDADCDSKPRGGTSRGVEVTLAEEPSQFWLALQESNLSKFEQDRRAILAMQGGYKVNFDFLETIGFSDRFERDRPYQSWGTEYVYVVEDTPTFISLQHVMVMFFQKEDGGVSDPMVMKHWRQDWTYEDTNLLEYNHERSWVNRPIELSLMRGRWSQAVFQVDDSPRYESIGEWEHNSSFSSWKSAKTRRPLPRREYSIRQDYNVLEGFNTHVVNRHGWVQVEENWKLVTDSDGHPDRKQPYVSKEQGVARYQPVVGFDFSAGDDYMARSAQFWRDVRSIWTMRTSATKTLTLNDKVEGKPLFMSLFSYASNIADNKAYNSQDGKRFASSEIDKYIQ